jgi:hypothetical protein
MQKIIEAEKSDLFDVLAHDIKRPDLSKLLRDNFERYRWKS